ncbi:MAG: hypothetical protein ACTHWZ_02875 [Peptoniphilaceae bacterium]
MKKIKKIENLEYCQLEKENLDQVLDLMNKIYEKIENKETFATDTKKDLEDAIDSGGLVLGVYKEMELLAFRYLRIEKYEDSIIKNIKNIRIDQEKIVHHESTMVEESIRGRGVQNKTREILEKLMTEKGYKHFLSTVSPDNPYSYRNVFKYNYYIVDLVYAYPDETYPEGKKRFLFYRNSENNLTFTDQEIILDRREDEKIKEILEAGYLGVNYKDDNIIFKKLKNK